MKAFTATLVWTILAVCSAGVLNTDFSTTNEQGGYHFGFNDGRQARQEERSPEGVVRGAYTYVDANGEVQTVTYTADNHNGFVASGSNIPKIGRIPEPGQQGEIIEVAPAGFVEDTPEVKAARAEHLIAYQRELQGEGRNAPVVQELLPVQYTPEVAVARSEHLNTLQQAYLRTGGYFPVSEVSQPQIQYVIPGAQYHPDYLPYAGL